MKPQASSPRPPRHLFFSALDSTAATVDYRGPIDQIGPNHYQALGKIGRQYGTLSIRLLDANKNELCSKTISVDSATDIQPSTSNCLLVIGTNEQIEANLKSATSVLMGKEPYSVLGAKTSGELPSQWAGYDGVNTVFLSTDDLPLLQSIKPTQWDALETWVHRGGRLILSADGQKGLLQPNGLLSRFLVGNFTETTKLNSVTKLDNYTKNRLDTNELSVANLSITDGKVELAEGSSPLIIRQVNEFGQIVFVTFDVNAPVFKDWKGNDSMYLRILQSGDDINALGGDRKSIPMNLHGFRDISGQLRIPLEQFRKVKLINFTVVAVLIGIFILCIGPGDFFFLKRVARKMELTWITFLMIALAFCGLAYWLASWSRPQEFQINQLEIIDIDATSNKIRGNAWSNLFSPSTGKHRIDFDSKNAFGFQIDDHMICWHGTPGDGIGGMQTNAGLTTGRNSYTSQFQLTNNQLSTHIDEFPLQVSSTRLFHAEWSGKLASKIESKLQLKDSQLVGQIVNPFPFELKNVRVMYGNYTYILSNPLAPETPFDLLSETRERTSKSYLTRRGGGENTGRKDRAQNLPWDPINSRLERIAEMMMFYEIANGQDYTSLTHRYQNRIEMSEHLACNRAILIGEVDKKTCQIEIDGDDSTQHYDKQITVFRILLPVE